MHDEQTLMILAGRGGFGRVSFYREKFIPRGGPDGGDGGMGGDVIIRGSRHRVTLQHLLGVTNIVAPDGEPGGKRRCIGGKAESVVIEVPLGTTIWLLAENAISAKRRAAQLPTDWGKPQSLTPQNQRYQVLKEGEQLFLPDPDPVEEPLAERLLLVEITEDGQEYVICRGGKGGRGNEAFKGPANTTPMEAEYGEPGEQRQVLFEVKLIADLGLVGFPNAGKSTFLKRVTRANPKIANYPFTTLYPNLGIWNQAIVVADIPGLIEGASEGKGLGFRFLRHIERCKVMLFLLALNEQELFDADKVAVKLAQSLVSQLKQLQHELAEYHLDLLKRPALVVINKVDLLSAELQTAIKIAFKKEKVAIYFCSAATGEGVADLVSPVTALLATSQTAV